MRIRRAHLRSWASWRTTGDAKVHAATRDNLTALIELFFKNKPDPDQIPCKDFERLLPLAISAHSFYPVGDSRTVRVAKRTNAAYRACSSLEVATGLDHHKILGTEQADPDILLEVYIWALWFIEAELCPDIELSAETRTHRYPLYVADYPDLYRYHRENLYAVMQLGELDLFASFVDTLGQYGCTPENEVQVRDGSRFTLKIFHDSKDRWMNYRQEGETDAELDDYDIVHYPWTAVLGLRDRKPEQPKPGTYGALIRSWLPDPR